MKKFAIILVLLFATRTTVGMEKEVQEIEGVLSFNFTPTSSFCTTFPSKEATDMGRVFLQNNLRPYPTAIECQITNHNNTTKKIIILNGKKAVLGEIASITKIEVSNCVTQSAPYTSRVLLVGVIGDRYIKSWDDITSLLTTHKENNNCLITVTWKHSFEWNNLQTYYSREWNYALESLNEQINDESNTSVYMNCFNLCLAQIKSTYENTIKRKFNIQ